MIPLATTFTIYWTFDLYTPYRLLGIKSAMIGHIPSYQSHLESWLSSAGFGEKYWVPCYRGPTDGWSTHTFFQKCSERGPSLTLIRKDSFVFGGFTDMDWKSKLVCCVWNILWVWYFQSVAECSYFYWDQDWEWLWPNTFNSMINEIIRQVSIVKIVKSILYVYMNENISKLDTKFTSFFRLFFATE